MKRKILEGASRTNSRMRSQLF